MQFPSCMQSAAAVEALFMASSPHVVSHIVQVHYAQPCLALLHYFYGAILLGTTTHDNIPL